MKFQEIVSLIPEAYRKRGGRVAASIFLKALLDFAGVVVLIPVLVQVLDKGGDAWSVLPAALGALAFILVKNLVVWGLTRYRSRYVFSLYGELSERALRTFLSRGLLFIKQSNSVDLANKVNAVTMTFITGVLLALLNALSSVFLLIIILVSLFIYDPLATLMLVLVLGPLLCIYSLVIRRRMKALGKEENEARRNQIRTVLEFFRGYSDYCINDASERQLSRFRGYVGQVSDMRLHMESYSALSSGIMEVSVILAVIVLMFMSLSSAWGLSVTFGVFALSAMKILPSVRTVIGSWQSYQSSSYSITVLEEIFSPVETPVTANGQVSFGSTLELRDVGFRYPDAPDFLFRHLNLTLRKGEYVGLKGCSGIGKTTLFHLMMGFFRPEEGGLYVDGCQIGPGEVRSWQDQLGYVPQDVFLVNGTFVENIAFGVAPESVDRSRIEEILGKVGLLDWVMDLPSGMDTRLAEAGNSISGGQKQRIGIARALYKGASVLFFDEATSSVDIKAEQEINRFIKELSDKDSSLTVVVIAHRQETLSSCARIIDLDLCLAQNQS